MNLFRILKSIVKNKVILYALSRYVIMGISFITSIFIAAKLGPYYFGIWGFILLLLNYFQYFDFGVSDSTTILLVQNKGNVKRVEDFEKSSIILSIISGFIVVLIAVYYSVWGISAFEKYNVGNLFYFVSVVAILFYINKLFFKIYRVKGKVFEFAFYQSINVILVFIVVFFARERQLIYILISAYITGHFLSLLVFIKGGGISFKGHLNISDLAIILKKGISLFLYNFFFYLILLSTRTIISTNYTVEEFGYFSFSYTIANAILLVLDAFAVLVIPKVIDRLYSKDVSIVDATLSELKTNYVYLSYGLMSIVLIIYPILLYFLPRYSDTFQTMNFLALAVVLSTNSFGYSMYLKAINKENTLAIISLVSFLSNIVIALFLVKVLEVQYSFVIISVMISYLVFAFLCVYYGKKEMKGNLNFISIVKEILPMQIFIPILSVIIITYLNSKELIYIPLILYVILNVKTLRKIFTTIKKILNNSKIFDIN